MRTGHVIYPFEPWTVTEEGFDIGTNLRDETVFAVGNGYIGIRGNFEEGYDGPPGTSVNGTYLNGFYDTAPIAYPKARHYGHPAFHQTMLNVADAKIIELCVDGEKFSLVRGKIEQYRRRLDMRTGTVVREQIWETKSGKRIRIRIERFAALTNRHLALIRYEAEPLNFSGELVLISAINGDVANQAGSGDPRAGSAFAGRVLETVESYDRGTFGALLQRTSGTRFLVICGMEHRVHPGYELDTATKGERLEKRFRVKAEAGRPVVLDKFIAYHTSRDYPERELLERSVRELEAAKAAGFERIAAQHKAYLDAFWSRADVTIEGDIALQQALRFNAFHLLQSVGRDGRTSIAAKGVTGEGYDGHYFWDTEMYVLPFFLYTKPDIAKQLLRYRHHVLPKAKARAEEMGQAGALFAWRTIGGEETSPYPATSTAQIHINADICHALRLYVEATGDKAFLYREGAEMLFETSRFYVDYGAWIDGRGFCLTGVTGPDEYTTLVDNNAYTNLMVKEQLAYAVRVAAEMRSECPERWEELREAMGLSDEELAEWERAARHMYLHRQDGLIGQDDAFLNKPVWDFANTPKDRYPLMMHYHALQLNRHQVLKQADLVMAMYTLGHRFASWEKLRNFRYYEPLTTHDSSLSACIHGIVGAELGDLDRAHAYFAQTARVDLDDLHANTKDGIHTASMAGSWLMIAAGFAGMRQVDGELRFRPELPSGWQSCAFRVTFRGSLLSVKITPEHTTYRLEEGEPVRIRHLGSPVRIGGEVTLPNRRLEAVIFDLDGVLTDTAELHYRAWKELADELGIPFDRAFNETLKGIDRRGSLELILRRGGRTFTEEEKRRLMERKDARYRELIRSIGPEHLLPGIRELLDELRASGIRTAVASASRNAPFILAALGLEARFDVVVDAGALERGKPDPEIFLRAADALGVPPKNCVGIEDALSGLEALRAANMASVGVGAATSGHADVTVSSTGELTRELINRAFDARWRRK